MRLARHKIMFRLVEFLIAILSDIEETECVTGVQLKEFMMEILFSCDLPDASRGVGI